MNGKQYNRALRVHKIVLETLERLVLNQFQEEHGNSPAQTQINIESVANDRSSESVLNALSGEGFGKLMHKYNNCKDEIRNGKLGKTAQFWLKHMD